MVHMGISGLGFRVGDVGFRVQGLGSKLLKVGVI